MAFNIKYQVERFYPNVKNGLSEKQVKQRKEQKLTNINKQIHSKSVSRIILNNTLTPFNMLNFVLAIFIIAVQSYQNLVFMGVVVSNMLISIFQEIRAKKVIDRLSLISAPKAQVMRNGNTVQIAVDDIVLDDLCLLSAGQQVCADSCIYEGECEVDESLLTGESDPVFKKVGDMILSGSFIVSGNCYARVEHVASDNYAAKISEKTKYHTKNHSEILLAFNKIVKVIGILMVIIAPLLFYKQYFLLGESFQVSVVSTAAALIGMIPQGLILLTSAVLTVSIIRLAAKQTLAQELYSIETLARVDTMCLDKTGTITEGTMQLDNIIPIGDIKKNQINKMLSALTSYLEDINPTFIALKSGHFPSSQETFINKIAFSSARKWSAVSVESGSYVLGAAEFVLKEHPDEYNKIKTDIHKYSAQGYRTLLLAFSDEKINLEESNNILCPKNIQIAALLLFSDKIRKEVPDTLKYLTEQGINIKVISGDNPITVSQIAKKVGLENYTSYIDASTMTSDEDLKATSSRYSIFGRMTPEQKLTLVKALKSQGHIVAMTGDGVNDVLALKESDCSIAMAFGSDAARCVAQIVLLDSNFSSMPKVVYEGRRTINNLQRSASLFLVRALFSAIIAVFFIFFPLAYPLLPIQFTLINFFTIGLPAFLLALEPNKKRIKGKFIDNILKKTFPGAIAMSLSMILLSFVCYFYFIPQHDFSTLSVLITGFVWFINLVHTCTPFNLLRVVLCISMLTGFLVCIFFFGWFFFLTAITFQMAVILSIFIPFNIISLFCSLKFIDFLYKHKKINNVK